jgi:YidC/Oxa1 family membrane protein insertase
VSALDPLNGVVAWVIMHIHTVLGHLFGPDTGLAWGLSIVLLVVAIRICLIPLFVKQVHAQRKMAQHAPHLQELRKKYKGDKQRLNEETMKFYKENGVNPLAGCLPMIPQMIVFYALFSVLRAIAGWNGKTALPYGLTVPVVKSAQKATVFGVHLGDKFTSLFAHPSLSPRVAIVIGLTVAVSASTTFMTVRQSSKRGLMQTNVDPDNPMAQSQKYMMYIIPFFSLTGLYWVYGLVLYWVTTNLWTLGQQYFMFRGWTVEPAGAAGATAAATPASSAVRTAQSSLRPGAVRPGSAAKPAAGSPRPGSGSARTGSSTGSATQVKRAGTAGSGSGSAGSGSPGSRPGGASNGSGGTRTGSASQGTGTTAPAPPAGANGGGMRGLLRLGRTKSEPEPELEVPTARVVRQQPVRQAKSKRSGKR